MRPVQAELVRRIIAEHAHRMVFALNLMLRYPDYDRVWKTPICFGAIGSDRRCVTNSRLPPNSTCWARAGRVRTSMSRHPTAPNNGFQTDSASRCR